MQTISMEALEAQLKHRWAFSYHWTKKQNNTDDGHTNWIYQSPWWHDVQTNLKNTPPSLHPYAINRWYNFWSAQAIETIIGTQKNIQRHENTKNTTIDFYWKTIPFDHKTTVFPNTFGKSLDYAKSHELELIDWLYTHQSQEQRCHYENRLFIIVYDRTHHEHWKCKAELRILHQYIYNFFSSFCLSKCPTLMHNGKRIYAPIIWAIF